jgi:hypothetical protein
VFTNALHHHVGVTFTFSIIFWAAVVIMVALAWWIISQFMVPVMYRQRCSAWKAFQKTFAFVTGHAAEVILFVLFLVVITIALGVIVLLVGVLTCCVGLCLFAIPYIGTVILLPVEILLFGYTLLFLRQFGNDWDVWATAEAGQTNTPGFSSPAFAPEISPATPPAPPSPEPPTPPAQT